MRSVFPALECFRREGATKKSAELFPAPHLATKTISLRLVLALVPVSILSPLTSLSLDPAIASALYSCLTYIPVWNILPPHISARPSYIQASLLELRLLADL